MGDNLETRFKAAIDGSNINGAIFYAIDTEGRFIYNNALGERTLLSGEKKPQQLDDVICLGSATKIITTIAALQCVEDGLLTLTGDLSSVAPDLATKQVITGFSHDGEIPQLEPPASPITLEMLLTHSSGISYDFISPHVGQWRKKFGLEGERQPVEVAYSYPLGFQPGTSWMYGPGLDWAGRIVELVTGHTLGEYMQQRIFKPLGVFDAQFYPVTREDLRSRLVDLNPQDPDCFGRAILGAGGKMNKRSEGHFGGHGLFMSGADFIKVLHSLLANDSRLLKPATVDDMFEDHLSQEAMAGYQAVLSGPMGDFFRGGIDVETKTGYGLGGLLTRSSIDSWYGERTLTWGGDLAFAWFIDRKNSLCGFGTIQPTLPSRCNGDKIAALKKLFCHGIYSKYAAWKQQQKA